MAERQVKTLKSVYLFVIHCYVIFDAQMSVSAIGLFAFF
jgi:hypothetical protein